MAQIVGFIFSAPPKMAMSLNFLLTPSTVLEAPIREAISTPFANRLTVIISVPSS